ncbi:MAG TPA: hypothetical protein VK923_14530 [Euzebyales bacterium]|nr:hypothetical protein [Euzebyales bacterium]
MTTDLLPKDALPLPVVLTAGAAVVVITAGLLSARAATRPDLPATRWHRDLPAAMTATLDRPGTRRATRLVALAGALAGLVGLAVHDGPVQGSTGVAVLTAAALVAGPLARIVNPVRLACGPSRGSSAGPAAPGWPAVAVLAVLSVVALAVDDGRMLAAVGAGHLALQAALCRLRGPSWPARGDGLEALATLIGRAAPLGRRADGHLAWRNPVVNAAHVVLPRPALWLTAVVVGLTIAATASTLAVPVFLTATATAGVLLRVGLIRPWLFGVVAPLAAAYGLLAGGRWLQPVDLMAFVALHAAATAVLHRQAIARHDPRTARAVQFPARCVVVVSVLAGLAVLASA